MLRIQRAANGEVVFTLSGQMDEEPITELEKLIHSETDGRSIILDLKDVTRVDENAIAFLERCEAKSITLKNCAGYIREWITIQGREAKD
jgi:anti-anti-sigma regulatory factor